MKNGRASRGSWTRSFFGCSAEGKLFSGSGQKWPADCRQLQFPRALWEKIVVLSEYSPPLWSMCSAVLLWKWAKLLHKKLDSLLWSKKRCSVLLVQKVNTGLYLNSHSGSASPYVMTSETRKEKESLIGGTIVQSELRPSVRSLYLVRRQKIKTLQLRGQFFFATVWESSHCRADLFLQRLHSSSIAILDHRIYFLTHTFCFKIINHL